MLTFRIYQALHDFQKALPGTRNYDLSLIELLARSCHEIAARLFRLDEGVHKHGVYEAWRDEPVDPSSNPITRPFRRPSVFCHGFYSSYDQYPRGIADVAGYWAEAKIFGGVIVFDRGSSGTVVSPVVCISQTANQLAFLKLTLCSRFPYSEKRCTFTEGPKRTR